MDKTLAKGKVVVIGCGGIGSALMSPLIRYLIHLPTAEQPSAVLFVDGDTYTLANAGRQDFALRQAGTNKADAQAHRFAVLYPGTIPFRGVSEFIGSKNIATLIGENDTVFMCVDNHTCRRIVSAHCSVLKAVTLISGGNELTDGNVQIFVRRKAKSLTPTLESRHPEILTTADGDRSVMSCEEIERLPGGGQIIFTNLMAAVLMLVAFWKVHQGRQDAIEVYFDIDKQAVRAVIDITDKVTKP